MILQGQFKHHSKVAVNYQVLSTLENPANNKL